MKNSGMTSTFCKIIVIVKSRAESSVLSWKNVLHNPIFAAAPSLNIPKTMVRQCSK